MREFDDNTHKVYTYVRDFIAEHGGLSPTLQEVAEGCFLGKTSVITHLARLEGRGWIARDFGQPRSIRLGEFAPDQFSIHGKE